jgi:ribosomal protein S27AE
MNKKRMENMSTADLPEFPAGIDPNAHEIRFAKYECRSCGERSEWFNADPYTFVPAADWDHRHAEKTGHDKFYLYTHTRNTSRVVTSSRKVRTAAEPATEQPQSDQDRDKTTCAHCGHYYASREALADHIDTRRMFGRCSSDEAHRSV